MGVTAHKIYRGENMRYEHENGDIVVIHGKGLSPERLERIKQICEEIEREENNGTD